MSSPRLDAREPGVALRRDGVTATGYAVLATFGWFLYALGPTIPLLRAEQGTSRAVAGLHSVAYAAGVVVAGVLTSRLVARMGRGGTIRLGLGVLTTGAALLVGGSLPDGGPVAVTIGAALIAGTGAALAANGANAALTDHHGPAGAAALNEGNAGAVTIGLLAPLAVGAATSAGLTWRAALVVFFPLAAGSWWLANRASDSATLLPPARLEGGSGDGAGSEGRLPAAYWTMWLALVSCIMVETAFVTWTPDLLVDRLSWERGPAAAATTALLVGMATGRILLSRFALRGPTRALFTSCLVVSALGWSVLWVAGTAWLALTGLVIAGLGIAGHFPLGSTLLIDASRGSVDRALGTLAVGVGVASGFGPFLLGASADRLGIHTAFVLVPVAVVVSLLVSAREGRSTPTPTPTAGPSSAVD